MFGNKEPTENTLTENFAGNVKRKGKWIVDSGATTHITHRKEWLDNQVTTSNEMQVSIPNGSLIPVEGKGACTLPNGLKINNVLHVPKFTCNLLSVSRLSNDLQCAVTFFPTFCVMQDLTTRKLIGAGECKDGLYEVDMVRNERKAMMVTLDVWYQRLAHASREKLSHFDFIDFSSKTSMFFCDSCVKAKHKRLPFPISSIKTKDCFELVHCDIWGKYRTPSLTQARYFLTIVDDYSRAVWVFLLKHKSEVSDCLIYFHQYAKTQFSKPIKRIRCDNGGEFTSNRMAKFYAESGILLETTCPHTPQQNGVVERKHRHLLETARSLRFEANLPKKFWGECILTAAHVINRLPSKLIENKTPYEIIHQEKPNFNLLRVFGCLAYYRNTDTNGDKLEERGKAGVFLGYPSGTKGYKVFDVQKNKMIISRDVKFIENIFPYKNRESQSIGKDDGVFCFPPWYYGDDNEVLKEKRESAAESIDVEENETERDHVEANTNGDNESTEFENSELIMRIMFLLLHLSRSVRRM
ncbi:putative RNA-directed DNA polymerase [Helianthus annuus]|nr:putative RNA-directed DNA polymerase [Helianthus annuus]KAJ0554028.1 putative RNA-directed DNA polymerase [Helianthus annuus]